ncbi:MAG: CHRD domain-containing protein [Bryobacteraceae bacterium]|nr:CHRD domain-containing protein [Bryobacteraceae bacterium]
MSGANESPANGSSGTGNGTVVIDDVAHAMALNVTFSGLTGNVTASHIHCCTVVVNAGVATSTPTFSGFPSGVIFGSYSNTLDLTLASSYNASYVTANGGTVASAEAALLAGNCCRESVLEHPQLSGRYW